MIKFKPKVPPILQRASMFATMLMHMDALGEAIKRDFEATVATWAEQPEFKVTKIAEVFQIRILVETDDDVYMWVSRGVQPHVIEPIDPDGLLFYDYGGYDAKTSPDRIESNPGGENGSGIPTVSTYVYHPGIEARKFDEQIREKWEAYLDVYMESMFRQVAKVSGHGLEVTLVRASAPTLPKTFVAP